jgi:hypothetical protein
MEDLINGMTLDDPTKRPRIEEVLEKFALIRASLSKGKLRSPITSKEVPKISLVFQWTRQFLRTTRYVVSRHPAIPDETDSLHPSRASRAAMP